MKKSNNKWQMFKQFLHNELGIDKSDIQYWIKEAVHEEAKKIVNKSVGDFNVSRIVQKYIEAHQKWNKESIIEEFNRYDNTFKSSLKKEIMEKIANSLDIDIEVTTKKK